MTIITATIVILGLSALPGFSQQPVSCDAPLSEDQLLVLVRGHVPAARVRDYVAKCGIVEKITAAGMERLRSAGAAEAVLELLANTRSAAPDDLKVKAELELWDAVKTTRDPALYQEYLRLYPQGTFAAVARARLNEFTSPNATGTVPLPAAGKPGEETDRKETSPAAALDRVREWLSHGAYVTHHHGGVFRTYSDCAGDLVISSAGVSFAGTMMGSKVQHKINASWAQVKSIEVCDDGALCIKGGGDSLKLEFFSKKDFELVPQVIAEYRR